jgi:predicted O-methyltransferase YrrM
MPAELAPLIGILSMRPPKRVLEIGTFRGGTLWVWCNVAAPDATIVSVDLPGGPFGGGGYDAREVEGFAMRGQTLRLVLGDSHTPDVRAEVESALGGPVDFLFIDGDHSYSGVRTDYAMYSELVRGGGLIAFHDIVPGPLENVGGVPRYWQELHASGKREIIDDFGPGRPAIHGGYGIGVVRRETNS